MTRGSESGVLPSVEGELETGRVGIDLKAAGASNGEAELKVYWGVGVDGVGAYIGDGVVITVCDSYIK